jgi:ElaB/YqjD/DUF883 family membrane-anchored ribosome-binding protein
MAKASGGAMAKKAPGPESPPVASDVNRIKGDAESLANGIRGATSHQYERAQQLAKDTLNRSEDVIRRNPFSTMLASVGLGFFLGLLRGGRK